MSAPGTVRLPLFPLGTVLFPGVLLPLHVFEERYRRLVRDLLLAPEDARELGIIAIREGREVGSDGVQALNPVGTVARLRRVEPYTDGRFDIVTTAVQRFRLHGLVDGKPYLQGEVELLDDPPGAEPAELEVAAARVTLAYDEYRAALGDDGSLDQQVVDPARTSYLVAAGTVLELVDKQRLLEAPHTLARLLAELVLLRRETGLLEILPSLPAVELTHLPSSPN